MTRCRPDLILYGGDIRTQDPSCPQAEAIAVGGGRVLAVGRNDEIKSLADSETKIIHLEGRLVLPGMMDCHFHYYDWALGRNRLTLAEVKSYTEFMQTVTDAAARSQPDQWILGQGWNESDWPENRLPRLADLDRAAPNHPLALWRCDMHLAVVNSRALELAGIDENTPAPPEGVITRDASGRPNGILCETAIDLIRDIIPAPAEDELVEILRAGLPVIHALGLTGLHDTRVWKDVQGGALMLRIWQRLREQGDLSLRVWSSLPGESLDEAISLGLRTGLGDDRLRVGHLKYFADGGMGARTAWMIEPYLDAESGMPLMDPAELESAVNRADRAGLAVRIHVIGDRANREVISIFERLEANRSYKGPAVPHRLEHVQMIRPEDLIRLGRLGLAACVQPHNMILDINMIDECVGSKGKWTYAFGNILKAGVLTLFGSDAPVADPNPLFNIHAAVTRQRRDGTPSGGWYPESRVSVDEAVKAYTVSPARAYGLENELGSLTPGKRADLIVLDANIYECDPQKIGEAQVDLTVFDGRVVHRRV